MKAQRQRGLPPPYLLGTCADFFGSSVTVPASRVPTIGTLPGVSVYFVLPGIGIGYTVNGVGGTAMPTSARIATRAPNLNPKAQAIDGRSVKKRHFT